MVVLLTDWLASKSHHANEVVSLATTGSFWYVSFPSALGFILDVANLIFSLFFTAHS